MRINFRQGLIRVPTNFLSLSAGKVSLLIPAADSAVMTFADGINNYLVTERTQMIDAWIGPFVSGTNYWLYFDINVITGARTFGHTIHSPNEGAAAPTTPLTDQHWFDTTTNIMKVWTGASWARKIRVFAAELSSGSVFTSVSISSPIFTGTQIGNLANTPISVGSLVFDSVSGGPVKKSDGSFFTTEDLAITGIASSSHVKMGSIIIEAEAQSNIPSYSIVRFVDFNKVIVATNYLIDNGTYGIVDYGTTTGNSVNVTLEGLIENSDWDWTSAGINAPLYVDSSGYLTTTVPPTPIIVAAVVDRHTILLRPSSLFLNTFDDPMTPTNPGTATLSVAAVDVIHPIVVGDNDPRITSVNPHITDLTLHLTPNENNFLDTLVGYSGGLVAMDNSHNGITRTIVAPAAGITVTNGSGIAGNPTLVLADDLAAVEGLGATGIAVRTATSAWSTRSIIAPAAGITIANGDGVGGNPTLSLVNDLAAVESLATNGLVARTSDGIWTTRSVVAPAAGITIANGDGVSGAPTLSLADDLSAVEGLASNGMAVRTGTSAWTTRSIIAPASGIAVTSGDGIGGNPTISLVNDLAAVEGLTGTGFTTRTANSPEAWTTRSITAASGETTVTNGDGISGNVIIGLPDLGSPVTTSFKKITTDAKGRISVTANVIASDITTSLGYTPVNIAGSVMTGLLTLSGDPSQALHATTKQYVDNLANGLDPKGSVKAATTAAITLSGAQTIDVVSIIAGDRVLVKNQADQTTNGVYVAAVSTWTRAADAIPGTNLTAGSYFFVEQGTTYADSGWVLTADNPVTGASLLTFQQFSGAGQITAGAGISKNGNTLSVITPTSTNITINGSGIDLTATAVTAGTYRSMTVDAYGRITNGTNPSTLSGYGITDGQGLNANLTAISAFSGIGIAVRNTAGTWSQRSVTGTANQIAVTNGAGDGANPNLTLDTTYVQFPGTAGTFVSAGTSAQAITSISGGLRYDSTLARMRMNESAAWVDIGTVRTIAYTDPAAGVIHSTAYTGSTATITTTLTNDLQALEGLGSTGIAVRTAADTWAQRSIAGTAGRIGITNGNGVVGDPTIDLLTTGVTANTYTKVTVDVYGRVTTGYIAGAAGANAISDYGLTAVVQPLNTNLTNLAAYNTNGIIVQTAANSFAGRQLVATTGTTSTNLGITNPAGQAGDFTLTFQGDLGPMLAAQTSTGFPCRTAATTWAQRQITGTSNRISVTNPTGAAADPIIDISATYVGQATITTLGTITTGTWTGTPIAPTKGGTGISSNGAIDQHLSVSHTDSTVWEYKTISGTSNQVIVTHAAGSTTFSLPQSIDTAATIVFGNVNAPVIKSAITSLIDAANVVWNMNNGIHAAVTITANRTIDNPTNLQAGAVVVLKVVQDGVGAHTLSYGTAFKWAAASAPIVAPGANAVSILTFLSDGTNLYEMSRSLAVA